ncbi:MAG: response regulator [Acidobacteria bacterium]|nr:response regulator [Acidobacteriota bacterium]
MPGKILIADPNLDSYSSLESILKKQNYEVYKINDGNLVLAKVCEVQPQVLILSVKMPGIMGYDICLAIKNNPDLKDISVILTFGENEAFDYQKARRVGATRFLPKSVEPSLFVSLIGFIHSDNTRYSESFSGSFATSSELSHSNESDSFESDDIAVEIEPLDYADYDMDEGEIETIEVEGTEEVIYQFDEENLETIEDLEEIESIDEVQEIESIDEVQEIEVVEVFDEEKAIKQVEEKKETKKVERPIEDLPLKLNINSQDKEIELPGLELPKSPTTGRLKNIIVADSFGQVFEPPIVGDQFEYSEDLEDLLQVKHQLNSISCRECGASVLTEDVFCVECGVAVDESAVHIPADFSCGSCGKMINLGDVFCLNCGAVQ